MNNINLMDLANKAMDFFSSVTLWFNSSVGQGVLSFIKSVLAVVVDILQFFIKWISWIINHI